MYSDGPRTWKYAVPGALAILLFWGAWMLPEGSLKYASLLIALGLWCGWIALNNWWKVFTSHRTEMFAERQVALSRTPLVLLSENMKQMHPEAVRVLNRFGVRTSWQVRVGRNFGERDWVLADTNVHFGFIEFVLEHSKYGKLDPKSSFNRGSMKWDPDGLVEDRDQYDEFEKWMFARMMVTRSHGDFKPAEFIPPWTPALILETMGLTGEQDLYRPEEEFKAKDLGAAEAVQQAAQTTGGNGTHPVAEEDLELSDADLAALAIENSDYEANMLERARKLQNLKQFQS